MKIYAILLLGVVSSLASAQQKKIIAHDYKYHVEYLLTPSRYQTVKKLLAGSLKNAKKLGDVIQYDSYTACDKGNSVKIVLKPEKVMIDLGYDKENECLKALKVLSAKIAKSK